MSIRRITMHQSALRLAHASERQERAVAELPQIAPAPKAARARKPTKKKAAAKRRAR